MLSLNIIAILFKRVMNQRDQNDEHELFISLVTSVPIWKSLPAQKHLPHDKCSFGFIFNSLFGKFFVDQDTAREILENAPGVVIIDYRTSNHFPTPLEVSNKDDVAVGRIRQDVSQEGNHG